MLKLRRKTNERGASSFETALVLPLIILPLLFGAIEFSRAMYAYHFVGYAAREGSRWASVRGATCVSPMTNCGAALAGSGSVQTFIQGIIPAGMYDNGCSGTSSGSLCVVVSNTGLMADGITNCVTGSNPQDYPGCVVQVNVTYYYGFSLPYLSQLTAVKMSSTSQMTITQ
jgi:Flp pilus assembly protein TadG